MCPKLAKFPKDDKSLVVTLGLLFILISKIPML